MTSNDLLRTLELKRAAEDVTYRYQRLVDAKDLDGLAALVTDDVVLRRQDGEQRGRDAFLDLYRRFADSDVEVAQHMVTNVQVTELDPDTEDQRLQVDSCFLAITTHASGEARLMWGRYCDDVVRRADRWLLAAKRITLVRTAYVEESALASPDADSFGPRTP
ncbi:MAG: nuclear transport factor 2 family protein [Nocardioides sp.]|nr:nuclear transport factor 2 family protein [Nocardioides sp.]